MAENERVGMSNAQHSAKSGEWYTPARWIEAVRRTLGSIDIDPCSSKEANNVVKAGEWWGSGGRALERNWDVGRQTVFVNPPGSCIVIDGVFSECVNPVKTANGGRGRCSCKLPKQFMAKSLIQAYRGIDVIYLAFSVNQLRMLAELKWPPGVSISIALPAQRIPYLDPETLDPVKGTNCDSAFICMSKDPTTHERFKLEFNGEGCRVFTA